MPLVIIPRGFWGAEQVEDKVPMMTPVSQAIHTFTDSDPCETKDECLKAVKALQKEHIEDGLTDIKYNFLLGGDGNVYEGRGWTILPHFHPSYPELWETSMEIAHIGRPGVPSDEILHLAEELLHYGVRNDYIKSGFQYHMHFEDVDDDIDYNDYLGYARERLKTDKRVDERKIIEFVP